jgi:hypothetical protein
MQPLYVFLAQPPFAVVLVYVVAALVLATLVRRFWDYRLWEVALLAGLAGLANLAVRSLQDWFLIMLALGGPHVASWIRAWEAERAVVGARSPTALAQAFGSVTRFWDRMLSSAALCFQWRWPAAAFGVLFLLSVIPPLSRRMPIQNSREWPVAALDWMESQGLHGRFFAPPDYGSYIGWRLPDRALTYVDTRGFFFPGELIEDSHYIPQLGPQWQARLEGVLARGTDYFLLETTGPRGQLWERLRPHIDQPLYCDSQAVLLTAEQVRAFLSRAEYAVR